MERQKERVLANVRRKAYYIERYIALQALQNRNDRLFYRVLIDGDGGFMMNSQEMETAVRLGLDLVVIVLRDNGYGMIKWKQAVFLEALKQKTCIL